MGAGDHPRATFLLLGIESFAVTSLTKSPPNVINRCSWGNGRRNIFFIESNSLESTLYECRKCSRKMGMKRWFQERYKNDMLSVLYQILFSYDIEENIGNYSEKIWKIYFHNFFFWKLKGNINFKTCRYKKIVLIFLSRVLSYGWVKFYFQICTGFSFEYFKFFLIRFISSITSTNSV